MKTAAGLRLHDAQGFENLVMLGKTILLVLAEDELSLHDHIKHAAPAGNQLRLGVELALDGIRQTGGRRLVVSLLAVGDADVHGQSSSFCHGSGAGQALRAR